MSRIAAVTRMPSALSERAQHDLDGELAAVLAPPDQLDAGADLLGQRIRGGPSAVGDQPLGEALGDDVRDLLADQFVAAVAELLLGLDVEQDDLAAPGSPPPSRRAPPPAGRDIGLPSAPDALPRPCAR